MTAIFLIVAMLIGGACWAGRRPRRYYSDQYIDNDADLYCDNNDDNSCSSDDYQDSTPATESRDD